MKLRIKVMSDEGNVFLFCHRPPEVPPAPNPRQEARQIVPGPRTGANPRRP